ncbi:MAG: hypothetical protein ABSB70_09220 [Candidatus Velthaea sp.]
MTFFPLRPDLSDPSCISCISVRTSFALARLTFRRPVDVLRALVFFAAPAVREALFFVTDLFAVPAFFARAPLFFAAGAFLCGAFFALAIVRAEVFFAAVFFGADFFAADFLRGCELVRAAIASSFRGVDVVRIDTREPRASRSRGRSARAGYGVKRDAKTTMFPPGSRMPISCIP